MPENTEKFTILIVDDSLANRMLLEKIFAEDYVVAQAENGVRALEMLRAQPTISAVILDIQMPELDGFGVLRAMREDEQLRDIPVVVNTAGDDVDSQLKALEYGAMDIILKPYNSQLALNRVRNIINRRAAERQAAHTHMLEQLLRQSEMDEKTGIYNKQAFFRYTSELLAANPERKYVVILWDVDHFKVLNDVFGVEAGDRYLALVGQRMREQATDAMTYGHWEADRFVCCLEQQSFYDNKVTERITTMTVDLEVDFELVTRLGVYVVDNPELAPSLMCDRALLALQSTKGDYTTRVGYYSESMRSTLIEEQEIISEMDRALAQEQFVVFYQPQYDYTTGAMVSAEALVRWQHPTKGLISPAKFIPIFENNGFISTMDKYVWEQVCRHQRRWLDEGRAVVPVAVNISRRDIYNPNLSSFILSLVNRYSLDPSLLRLEITESAYMENAQQLIKTVEQLRAFGFSLEMDDFGSGYSSLNALKNVPVDVLKLDMKFLEDCPDNTRGGSILTSVVRMAHWINIPVIAEGVETKDKADYLKSIGCRLMQGYYFARPMPADDFEALLSSSVIEPPSEVSYASDDAANSFLSDSTQAALLFNSFVGGAAIMEFDGSNVELLRLNDRYFEVLGTTREEYEHYQNKILNRFDKENAQLFLQALQRAIDTGDESSCELCGYPLGDSNSPVWTEARMRVLAQRDNVYIVYLSVVNITRRMRLSEQLRAIMDSVPGGILDFEVSDSVTITYFNDYQATQFGYTREQYKEMFVASPFNAVHPEDRERLSKKVQVTLAGGEIQVDDSYRHRCADGSWRWVRMIASVVRRSRSAMDVSCIVIDIDDEISSHQLLSEQAEKLQRIYDSIPCGIALFGLTPDGKGLANIIEYNNTVWMILGYPDAESFLSSVNGCGRLKGVHPEDDERMNEAITDVFNDSSERRADLEHRIIRPDGSVRWVHSMIQRVVDAEGRRAVQVVFSDITERKEAQLLRVQTLDAQNETQKLFQTVVEQTGIAVIEMNYLTGESYCSELYNRYEASRYSLDELFANKADRAFVHPDDQEELERFFAATRDGTEYIEVRLRLKMTAGSYHWTRVSGSFSYDKDGSLLRSIGTFTDVDDNVRSRLQIVQLSERLQLILDNIPTGLVVFSLQGDYLPTYVSERACEMFGFTADEYGERIANGLPFNYMPEPSEQREEWVRTLREGRSLVIPKLHARRRDGSRFWIRVSCSVGKSVDNQPLCYALIADITDEVRREQDNSWKSEKYRILLETAGIITFDYAPAEDIMRLSLPGSAEGEVEQIYENYLEQFMNFHSISDDSRQEFYKMLSRAIGKASSGTLDFKADFMNRGVRWYRAKYVSLADESGTVFRIVGRLDDINDIISEQDMLRTEAQHDMLTGVYNKNYAVGAITDALSKKPVGSLDCVMFADVDDFKKINDNYGHIEADAVLGRIGEILNDMTERDDIVARFGGDEFIIYVRGVTDEQHCIDKANRLIARVNEILLGDGKQVRFSVGIAFIADEDIDYERAIRRADKALYQAKNDGKNQVVCIK